MIVTEHKRGNATIVVYRPELTADERKKKERRIEAALQQFGKAMQDAERGKRQCQKIG